MLNQYIDSWFYRLFHCVQKLYQLLIHEYCRFHNQCLKMNLIDQDENVVHFFLI